MKVIMKIVFTSVVVASVIFSAAAFGPSAALAQIQMTPEEAAIYRNMVESTGASPDLAAGAIPTVESAKRWTEGAISYHIVGDYQGKTDVIGDSNWTGYADVSDQVIIDLKWNLSDSTLVGTPVIVNKKSVVKDLRNSEPSCRPPVLKGEYEHYELLAIKQGLAGNLELQVQTAYPAAEVAQFCTGSNKAVAASLKTRPEELTVLSPVMLGMPLPDSDNLRVSPDKKSLIHKSAGWTWTFTPGTNN
jgi:hypothetical protein